jgi:hypothetical protein
MVRKLHLPFRAIEGSSLVGPAFWCEYDQEEDDRHLRMCPPPTLMNMFNHLHASALEMKQGFYGMGLTI